MMLYKGQYPGLAPVWEKVKKMYANVMYLQLLAPQRCTHWRACWSCDVDAFLVWFETHQDIECHTGSTKF